MHHTFLAAFGRFARQAEGDSATSSRRRRFPNLIRAERRYCISDQFSSATFPTAMRLRLTKTDLLELARLYRGAAAEARRRAETMERSTQTHLFIDQAMKSEQRAKTLENLAARAEDFVLMPTQPFNGGPPSLMVVGGCDASDGSAFVDKRGNRQRAKG